MKYYLKRIGKLFLGLAIMCIAFFPTMLSASFFVHECDFQAWIAMFTDSEGLPMSEGLIIAVIALVGLVFFVIITYGYYLIITAARTSGEELGERILDGLKKHVEEKQAKCPHDFVHQVGFTNMLKCDECGVTFENKHFVSE